MFIPEEENYTEMTPSEFEEYSVSMLKQQFQSKGVENIQFEHNVIKQAYDGEYQIDGVIKISVAGADIEILVECKRYKGPVKREHIQALYDKIRAVGAHKGFFVTTSYYQSGALKYAKEHGIATITIVNGILRYETREKGIIKTKSIPSWVDIPKYSMAMQTQTSDTTVTTLYIDNTDALYQFVIKD